MTTTTMPVEVLDDPSSSHAQKHIAQNLISNQKSTSETNISRKNSTGSLKDGYRPSLLSQSLKENPSNIVSTSQLYPKRTLIFRRSSSISIPISQATNEKVEELFSQGSSIKNRLHSNNYGSITKDVSNEFLSREEKHISYEQHNGTLQSNCEGVKSEEFTEKLYCGYTKRQLKVFLSLVLLSLNDIMGYSAIAPFFPVVAANKGLTALHVGLIFSAYSLCGLFASIFVGKVLVKVGAKFLVLAGMFWNTGAILCFGFLNYTAPLPFLILCIITRGLMGLGSNTAFTAMFAIVFQEFSDRAITVLSLSEALVGVGGMLAPLIGGVLYDAGGFITPFMVLGSCQALLIVLCWWMLPYVPIEEHMASKSPFYLLRHSSAFLATLVVIYVFTANSFIIANMAPFLKDQFNMNAAMVGVVFLVSSIFYAGMSPVWGFIADKWKGSYLMEIGTFCVGVGMTLAGPALFLQSLFGWTSQKEWLLFIAAIVNGAFFGGALMPTFNEMLNAAKELKLSDTVLAQYGLVSGLWNSAFAIGDVMGPTLGGVIVTKLGFQNSSALFGMIGFLLCFVKLIQRFVRHKLRQRQTLVVESDEEEPLLDGAGASVNA